MHKTSVEHFYDFFPNADSVPVVSPSSGSGQSQATKYILVALLMPIFRSLSGDVLIELLKSGVSVRSSTKSFAIWI